MNVIVILCDTLRRDHVGAYTDGKQLNQCWSAEAPEWRVPTPNMDRLAERGTIFDNCYCGSTPCMPARRDIYTGRLEFLERGWGPLEESDFDLPRQVSGPPNRAMTEVIANNYRVSYLLSDHFHLWEQGAGNYHMGYSGFDFIRGCEADAYYTAPLSGFYCPDSSQGYKPERHWRNVHYLRQSEEDYFCAQVFNKASAWLERNQEYQDFYLHLDIFDPHEPWDPPEELTKKFDPKGNKIKDALANPPYAPWRGNISEELFHNLRARYAAKVVFLDKYLGKLIDQLDRLELWDDTVVILTTDHGTFNGDHGRMGKLNTHQFDALAHIPFVVAHPGGTGMRNKQLVQLVDIYPTVLDAVNRPQPDLPAETPLHGKSLLPLLGDSEAKVRDYALTGMFGKSTSITDGSWILHQSPLTDNQPLYWYGYHLARFLPYELGDFDGTRREVFNCQSWEEETWLSNKNEDMNELVNLVNNNPDKLQEMQKALRKMLIELKAPKEQLVRLKI